MKKLLTAGVVMLLGIFTAMNVAANSRSVSPHPLGERSIFSDRAIADRIRAVGSVCIEGEECGEAAPVAEVVASGPRSGEQVYNSACAACHNSGAAGAPMKNDADAWGARLAEKGRDTLLQNSINGIGAMPPMGMCMDCSEEEILASIDYILAENGL